MSLKQPYQNITLSIFNLYEEKIRIIPDSINYGCGIRGGFLKHLITTVSIGMNILKKYSSFNKNLTLCSILINNIGKVHSFNNELDPGYTDAGRLIDYRILGINILRDAALSCNFPDELLLKLEHMMLLNKYDVGGKNIVAPCFPEALLVQYIEELVSQLDVMLDSINNDPNKNWTDNHNPFNTKLYKK